jgi:hypothetical protein
MGPHTKNSLDALLVPAAATPGAREALISLPAFNAPILLRIVLADPAAGVAPATVRVVNDLYLLDQAQRARIREWLLERGNGAADFNEYPEPAPPAAPRGLLGKLLGLPAPASGAMLARDDPRHPCHFEDGAEGVEAKVAYEALVHDETQTFAKRCVVLLCRAAWQPEETLDIVLRDGEALAFTEDFDIEFLQFKDPEEMAHGPAAARALLEEARRTGKAARHLRPGADSRREAVDLIAWGVADADEFFREQMERSRGTSTEGLSVTYEDIAALNAEDYFFFATGHACNRIMRGDAQAWDLVREAFTADTLARALYLDRELAEGQNFEDRPLGDPRCLLQYYFLALAGGACAQADWILNYLRNYTRHGGMESVFDDDLVNFTWELCKAHFKKTWPAADDLSGMDDEFAQLFLTAHDPAAFTGALAAYCDLRLSRAYGFEQRHSKRLRASEIDYMFQSQWFGLWPLELLALRAVHERCTGRQLLLTGHPLLETPLMQVPSLAQPADSELTLRLQALGEKKYGPGWDRLRRVLPFE